MLRLTTQDCNNIVILFMTVSDYLEQPCNKSDNVNKVEQPCNKSDNVNKVEQPCNKSDNVNKVVTSC